MKIRSHIRPWLYRFTIVMCFLSATASAYMIWKTTERNAYVKSFMHSSLDSKKLSNRDDTVLAISRTIYALTNNKYGTDPASMDWYDRFESTFFFNMSSTVALKYRSFGVHGHYVFGPCGTMSRLLLNTLWDLNIPARKLQLLNNSNGKGGGHTLVEYFDEGKWKVVAVSDSSFVWRNAEGQIASVAEIQHDPAVFSQIYAYQANYPYLFDNPKHFN